MPKAYVSLWSRIRRIKHVFASASPRGGWAGEQWLGGKMTRGQAGQTRARLAWGGHARCAPGGRPCRSAPEQGLARRHAATLGLGTRHRTGEGKVDKCPTGGRPRDRRSGASGRSGQGCQQCIHRCSSYGCESKYIQGRAAPGRARELGRMPAVPGNVQSAVPRAAPCFADRSAVGVHVPGWHADCSLCSKDRRHCLV